MGKLLLIMGPSAVGKSTIIRALTRLDARFVAVRPFTTRAVRPGETEKIPVTPKAFWSLQRAGRFLVVNRLYGYLYGTPKEPIEAALATGRYPVLDWPISRIGVIEAGMGPRLHRVYVAPPSIGMLTRNLRDGRDPDGERLRLAETELRALTNGRYDGIIDFRVINSEGNPEATARSICRNYLDCISPSPVNSNETG